MKTVEELKIEIGSRADVIKANIAEYCKEAGRDSSSVTLVGVSKVFPVEYAQAAFLYGLSNLAENKPQDLRDKYDRLSELGLKPDWHMIGTLQKNKVKYVVGRASLIHSVDSVELAEEISRKSEEKGLVSDILIQVNVSGEETKHGFTTEDSHKALESINALAGVRARGLMTMAPKQNYDGEARGVFEKTYKLYESLKGEAEDASKWDVLSMGMSQDYKWAILEGSTHVRIGTAIFGDRNYIDID